MVLIILCSNLNENCLTLLSFVDLYMNEIFFPKSVKQSGNLFFSVFNTSRCGGTVSIKNFIVVFAVYFS